jgi:plastocyanin
MPHLSRAAVALAAVAWLAGPAAAQQWGTVKGQVVFAGAKAPERPTLNVDKDKEHCESKGKLLSEDWIVDPKTLGVKNVLVWLAPATAGDKLPVHPQVAAAVKKQVEMDQPCCQFEAHVLGIVQGQKLVVKNSAPVAHNVMWTGIKNTSGNVIVPAGQQHVIEGLVPEKLPVSVKCSIHPWMNARVGVFDHPYFAVTDAQGKFSIPKAPAGNYRIFVWHESAGWLGGKEGRNGQPITIKADGDTDVGTLKLAAAK